MREEHSLWGPALGTLVFVLIVPGTVIVGVPYLLTAWEMSAPFLNLPLTRWIGVVLFLAALPLFLEFLVRFVAEGRGTPAPVAPTKRLVVGGPFRWVRNPGYIAVLGLIVAQGLFFAHTGVLIYAASLAVAFHLFVLLYEEPTLRQQFGTEYEQYCRHVPRWIPRWPTSETES